ncbi:hypothetical protein [Olleya marilimosa]|uniref:hypothetical protein n=1 Tax=Olleya marilimosa TaxID=272164 RepID=UPI0030EEF361|tara:strand:- start:78160 stop:79272 length:1113 start_codon:yes stop_codon:yes gene_type:complete
MAIQINNEIDGIYPAYNDSYIQFESTLTGSTKAVIQLLPQTTFPKPFELYSNINGVFIFNLKEAVKSRFNQYGFEDIYTTYPTGWSRNIQNLTLTQHLEITDYNTETSGATLTKSYEFFKSVKQIGEPVFYNNTQILNNSINGVDYNLTYFEGYPFSFELQKVIENDSIKIRSRNTSLFSNNLISDSTNAMRIYIDKVSSNWTTSNFLPLQDSLNKLEIFNNGVLTTNFNLKKVPAKCGVYLKWFNNDGGYSYYLFDEYYNSSSTFKSVGEVSRNSFNNVIDGLKSPTMNIGKEGSENLAVRTVADENEVQHLKSLFSSPSVQMWSSNNPFINGKWQTVTISGNHSYSTKKALNEVKLTINLPEQITIKL